MKFPYIGITPDLSEQAAPETEYVVRRNYADAIAGAGGLPFVLPYTLQVDAYLDAIDGLLVTGGMFDIDPAMYRQTARKQYLMKPARTEFERALIVGAVSRSIPILGICNGMQLLAVCLGGELVQDIPSELNDPLEHKPGQSASVAHHAITIRGPSRHLNLPTGSSHRVNSVHHQSVLASGAYEIIAVSPDGVVEAIEARTDSFTVGVQWHPEYGVSAVDETIFKTFVSNAANYSSKRN